MKFWRLFSLGKFSELKRPSHPVDDELEKRIQDAKLPPNSIKPDRVVRDWPRDGTGSPIDYDDGLPNG